MFPYSKLASIEAVSAPLLLMYTKNCLIEYFDLSEQVEGRFAKEQDFSVNVK